MTKTNTSKAIAFIGAGNMASAIAQGLHAAGGYALSVSDPNAQALARWQADYAATRLPEGSLAGLDAIVLAVKPQQFAAAAAELTGRLDANTIVVSVMAGVTIDKISQALGSAQGGHTLVVRTMPNTPARIAQGITALCAAPACSPAHTALAGAMMASIGQTVWLTEESQIDAVTAISGSGPAYVFYIAQALAEGGAALGLAPETARQLALATLQGAAALAAHTGEDLANLREQVTSKGGTTAAALAVFKHAQLDETLKAATRAAHARAQVLARG